MSPSSTFSRWFAAASALVVSLSSAAAGWSGIEDRGEFFSAPAEAAAQRQITELQRGMKKDFAIETFATIPAEAGTAPLPTEKAARDRFMEQWAEKQAAAKRVNGVYALLVKTPPHLQVVVGNETQRKVFTLGDREALVSLMLGKLRAKDFDGALTEGVSFVAATMRSHAGSVPGALATSGNVGGEREWERAQPATTPKSSWGWLVPIVLVALGVWLVMGLIRALRGGGSPAAPGVGGGGGGFMSSMMGGLFGAAAGMWMYNQFFGSGTSAVGSDSSPSGPDSGASGHSGEDTGYSGSGGSFGDDSGGGGGGDFGGGGDSGGGGGGDF